MNAIETINLTKVYKNSVAVDALNLTVKKGELFSLLGVNGAGKTTTIKMLSTLTAASSGDAFILGNSINSSSFDVKKIIAVAPQETAIAQNLSVKENLQFMCGIHGLSKAITAKKTDELSKAFKLEPELNKKASRLSGGYQRRLSIAMALVGEPQVLFLDEPTLGLDVLSRSELWDIIRLIKGKITIILTTHYMQEAESLSDRIAIMKDGQLICTGSCDELKAQTGSQNLEDAFIAIVKGDLK